MQGVLACIDANGVCGEVSVAVTWPVVPTIASAASAANPVPVATSSTRPPEETRPAYRRKRMKCDEMRANARS
jgi:hypothetical protein